MDDEEVKDLIMKYISKINGEIKNHAFDLAKEFACKSNLDQNAIETKEVVANLLSQLCVHFSNAFIISISMIQGIDIKPCINALKKTILDSIDSQFDELSKKPTQKH